MSTPIDKMRVLNTMDQLPAFPAVVLKILQALDDPDACLTVLAQHIEHDAVVAGRVLSLANRAGSNSHGGEPVNDVFTAISLVGLSRVRETAVTISLAGFLNNMSPAGAMEAFWAHSIATAACGVEVASNTDLDVCIDASLMACLLHDVGQLWLQCFEPERLAAALQDAAARGIEIDVAEREQFGVDHGAIGAWLADAWGLSRGIVKAIEHHHAPDAALAEPLVAVVHVSEVLANALDLTGLTQGRVTWVSAPCCGLLGLDWGPDSQSLFGRIEARGRQALSLLA